MRCWLVLVLGWLVACGSTPRSPTPEPTMGPFTLNGYELTGAEYWPYTGQADIEYPEEVLWGFYPEKGVVPPGETDPNPATARAAAVACARRAWGELRRYLAGPHAKLDKIVALGAKTQTIVPRFYLWTNDYTAAADPYPPGVRDARLWWWARKKPEPPKPPGYWKWESVLNQKGECLTPQPAQIDAYLDDMLSKLESASR